MMPLLSILIPSIPSRFDRAIKLYNHILQLVGDKDIEIIMVTDNKVMTIGEKRDWLKSMAHGKYFMFVDDDDSLLSLDEIYTACHEETDVITFKVECRNDDGSTYIVTHGLGNAVEHKTENGRYLDIKRPPFHNCAWRRKFRAFEFPDVSYAEDWVWVQKCLAVAKDEIHIDRVLTKYNFDSSVSEASTESNHVWKNPNEIANGPRIIQIWKDEQPPRRCIVNLATGKYIDGQYRLRHSMIANDFIGFQSEGQVDAPPHEANPYAFKIYAIEEAQRHGYNQILWLDASVYAVKNIQPIFDWLDKHDIFMEEAGHWAGTWSPQYVLDYFNITKIEAMKMPMFSAGFVGLDFRKEISREFFARWKNAMLAGMFKGSWSDHRHDMTVGSIIANQMGLVDRYSPGGQFFAYVGPGYSEPKPTACFHLRGI
jgi:hypothetical protein